MYLKSYLLKKGIPSTTVDIAPRRLSVELFQQEVAALQPRVIGFTGSPYERAVLHEYIRDIKEFSPSSLIVAGGPYFTATAEECLNAIPDVDVIVRGEGEITFYELVLAWENGTDFSKIDGITYRSVSGEIHCNWDRKPTDRDEFEVDARLIPNDETYTPFVYLKNFEKEGVRALPIFLARGCKQLCTFCFNIISSRFQSRSIPLIINEIRQKRELFDCDYFWMVDPMFTLKKKFAWDLCEALIEHCPGIKWYCETRADCDLELLGMMAKAGCISVDFALESGSQKVLNAIKKGLKLDCVYRFAEESQKLGMRSLAFVIYSLPEETYEEFEKTLEVLDDIKDYLYDIDINPLQILPGTEIEKQARELEILPSDFSWYNPKYRDVPQWRYLLSPEQWQECLVRLKAFKRELELRHS